MNDARGGEEEDQDDEAGDNGPGEFHLIAAIDGRGLRAIFVAAAAEFQDGIDQEPANNYKDQAGDDENENGEAIDGVCRRGSGFKNVGDRGGLSKSEGRLRTQDNRAKQGDAFGERMTAATIPRLPQVCMSHGRYSYRGPEAQHQGGSSVFTEALD